MQADGAGVQLFAFSTEGVILGIGLFVLTLAMMISIWFMMKAIAPEPFTFYTFPGRLYTFRILQESVPELVITNTFSAAVMWPLGILVFGGLFAIMLVVLMLTTLWAFSFSVINFWVWWTYLFCVGQKFTFDGMAGTLTVQGSWMGVPIPGSRKVVPLSCLKKCRLERRQRTEKGWPIPYYAVELQLREPLEGRLFITKKKVSIERIQPFVDSINKFIRAYQQHTEA
jgi:hypothetical protein